MNHFDTYEKLQRLDDGPYSLGVPTHPDDSSIVLNGLGDKRKAIKSRIAIEKTGTSLRIRREDIFPLQMAKVYEKRKADVLLMPAPVSVLGIRRVLLIPEVEIHAHCDDLKWNHNVFLADPDTGIEDFSEFLGKIVQVANAKQNKLKNG